MLALLTSATLTAQSFTDGYGLDPQFSIGFRGGYNAGVGFEAFGTVSNFAVGFPLALRLGISRTDVEPGRAWDARRIFINDATNGDPEKKGNTLAVKLDFLLPVNTSVPNTLAYAGIRHSRFTGNFNFVGGNEDFDITSGQWGLGVGLESSFAMSRNVDFVINGGMDHFFSATLSGHDTSYSPDGEDVNGRNDYTFADADAAVAQPKWEPVVMLGIAYRF